MGTQINFYMASEDELKFVEYLHSQDGVRILKDWTESMKPTELEHLPEPGTPGWFQVWLYNSNVSPFPTTHFVDKQSRYCIDPFSQEVIEFDRSVGREGFVERGRLWAEFSGWDRSDPHVTIQKSDDFRRWFKRLAGWIKRSASRNDVGDYVMPAAARFAAEGGRLVQAAFADGTTVEG